MENKMKFAVLSSKDLRKWVGIFGTLVAVSFLN